jgi:hypothetical protein
MRGRTTFRKIFSHTELMAVKLGLDVSSRYRSALRVTSCSRCSGVRALVPDQLTPRWTIGRLRPKGKQRRNLA